MFLSLSEGSVTAASGSSNPRLLPSAETHTVVRYWSRRSISGRAVQSEVPTPRDLAR